jgi:hypothetical protein
VLPGAHLFVWSIFIHILGGGVPGWGPGQHGVGMAARDEVGGRAADVAGGRLPGTDGCTLLIAQPWIASCVGLR